MRIALVAALWAVALGCGPASTGDSTGPQSNRLTVAVNGLGTVTSVPAGIDCGAKCSAAFPLGAPVALTAAPAAGFVFSGWSDACSGAGTCTVTLAKDLSVTARFASMTPPPPETHRLTVAVQGQGSVTSTPGGIDCGVACLASFQAGLHVVLTAHPAGGWSFSGWSGGCSGSGDCDVTLSADASITARFSEIPPPPQVRHALTVIVSGQGKVTSMPEGIDCTLTCRADFVDGASVTLTAAAESGWQFSGWSGACTGASCTVRMTGDASATATFTQYPPPPPIISVSIAPSSVKLFVGGTFRFTATVTGSIDGLVLWTVAEGESGGAVDTTGFYVAPARPGTYHVVAASHADPLKTATATVVVTQRPAVTVSVMPSDVAMPSNTRPNWPFRAIVSGAPDGSVTWSIQEGAAGGTIDSTGIYTSPLTSGVFHIVATSNADRSAFGTAIVRTNTPLVDQGGTVLPTVAVYAIWWGSSSVFADGPAQMASLFGGLNGSAYLRTLDQYMRGSKAAVSFAGNLFDSSSPPETPLLRIPLAEKVCTVLDANGISPRADEFYALFVDNDPDGFVDYHGWGTCHGVSVHTALILSPFFGNDGPDACGRSQLNDSFAGTAAHELFEGMTDADVFGWTDPLNSFAPEIADKCPIPVFTCNVKLSNGSSWRLPAMWSNSAGQCVFETP